ncbi:hypothetical protein L6452_42674 [Arctium lappa]|uniref:Uncharacterized protein n=1 Tax=Arctium lappa TaxID=4217 RepID=A0ACB8XJN9_ARCLA|nr:hypothetical protein L6452_42674 [Arctium lappa]
MAITKAKPRKRSHADMKKDESSSENSPNKHPSPSKEISKEKQPPTKRLPRSSSRFKTKPMTEDEGFIIALSKDLRGENANEVDYEIVVSKLSTTALDALAAVAGAEVQTPESTPVQAKMIIPTEATSVVINPSPFEGTMFSTPLQVHRIDATPDLSTMAQISTLKASVDKAFAVMDELLDRRAIQATTVNTTITTTLETPPVIPENPITKPTENPSVEAPIILETPIPTPLTTPIPTPENSPFITPIETPKATKTPLLVSPYKIPDDTLFELLGINLTPKHQEQPSVNPTPPVQHQLVDELSEETLEPSPIASQHTEPLGTPVNNPSVNMAIDRPVDEAPPQFSLRAVEHSPSINHVSPVHTTTTPPTIGDAQEEDGEVDMTRVKRRTMSKKKLKAKKKQKKAKEVEVAEDTEVEDISPPKRITRQGAQSMAQSEGSNRTDLQNSRSTSRRSKDRIMRFTNNPRPPSVIEAVDEMKNTILGEVQKATTKLKKTIKARTDKLKGKINELQIEVRTLKEERVKWLEYKIEKDRVKKREWKKMNPDKQMTLPPFPTVCLQKLAPTPE